MDVLSSRKAQLNSNLLRAETPVAVHRAQGGMFSLLELEAVVTGKKPSLLD